MLHSWNVGRRVCGSGSLFPRRVFREVHLSPVSLVKAHVRFCLLRAWEQTSVFSLVFQMHQVRFCFLLSLTYFWTIETLPVFRTLVINSPIICLFVLHTVEGFSSVFYRCFGHSPQQAYIIKVKADVVLGGDLVNNTFSLSSGSEPTEMEQWQAGGDQMPP